MPVTQVPPGLGTAISGEEWARYILDRLSISSVVLRAGARQVRTRAPKLHIPRFTSDGSAGWYEELEPINEGSPTGDDLEFNPKKCASIARLSNEVVADADAGSINSIGDKIMQAVGLTVDRALLVGAGGKQPVGVLGQIVQNVPGDVADYDNTVDAISEITQHGGTPDTMFVAPADWKALLKLRDQVDRPLIAPDVVEAAAPRFVSLAIYSTPALPAGTAIVCQVDEIIACIRRDASVEMSREAEFVSDATLAAWSPGLTSGSTMFEGYARSSRRPGPRRRSSAPARRAPRRLPPAVRRHPRRPLRDRRRRLRRRHQYAVRDAPRRAPAPPRARGRVRAPEADDRRDLGHLVLAAGRVRSTAQLGRGVDDVDVGEDNPTDG